MKTKLILLCVAGILLNGCSGTGYVTEQPTRSTSTTANEPAYMQQNDLDTRINSLAIQISNKMSQTNKTSIAVIEFSDLNGQVTNLGKFLAEEVITKLFQSNKFKVIERQLLNKVIEEQKLQVSGIIDERSVKELGNLLGVEAIVSGTVTELANSVRINARLIGTETGEIFGAASSEIPKDESIRKLIASGGPEPSAPEKEMHANNDQTTPSEPETAPAVIETEQEGFHFRVSECIRKRTTLVECVVIFKNLEENEIGLRMYGGGYRGKSYLYDNFGTQYSVKYVQIGEKETDRIMQQTFVPGLPVAVHFKAEGVNSKATLVTLTIKIQQFDRMVTLRDIPLTK
ncbi:MAG: FlgO family outer membrane protein [Candidatus Paceibacterota bacterium]